MVPTLEAAGVEEPAVPVLLALGPLRGLVATLRYKGQHREILREVVVPTVVLPHFHSVQNMAVEVVRQQKAATMPLLEVHLYSEVEVEVEVPH